MRGFPTSCLRHVFQLSMRSYSTPSAQAVDKNLLSKLRKQTGIPFINCKKALSKFDNDFDQAKKWLLEEAQKEGWARATKLQTRPMSQGLIAVFGDDKRATMLEVNCETDFVAKNEQFIAMVSKLVQECSSHFEKSKEKQVALNKAELDKITTSEQSTLADIVALNIGNLGENMALRRGAFVMADEGSTISSYVHPAGPKKSQKKLLLGKYGAIVQMCKNGTVDKPVMALSDLGSHLCQHIVGMNPKGIGVYPPTEGDGKADTGKKGGEQAEKEDTGYSSDVSSDTDDASLPDQEEDMLLQQGFLLDTSMTVGELLCINGVEVSHFVRYACGEELEGDGNS